MPSTVLQHPMNEYRSQVEIPEWLIVLDRDGRVIRFRDLATLRNFIKAEVEGTGIEPPPVSGLLEDVEKHLKNSDVYVLENNAGDRLHFCYRSFTQKRGYIQSVRNRKAGEHEAMS